MARKIIWRKKPCPVCGDRITVNAIGRAAHIRWCGVKKPAAKKPVPAKVDPTTQLGFLGPMPGFDTVGQWVRAQPIRGRRS